MNSVWSVVDAVVGDGLFGRVFATRGALIDAAEKELGIEIYDIRDYYTITETEVEG